MLKVWFERWSTGVDLQEHEDKILLLLSLVVSALVGLIVVAFVVLTERLGGMLVTAGPAQRFISPVLGSLIGGWLLFRFFPTARGSGIPQTRVALILQGGVIGLRTVIGKFVCSSISLGSGVALGREGPSVHIGAGIASVAGRRLGLSEENVKALIPVGTAAAVAAAFNTPLAAVLFTLEEILADLHARLVGSVVIGAATSWIVLRLILGDEPLFHVPAYQLIHPLEFLVYAVLGLFGGLVSTVFVRLLLWQRAAFQKLPVAWKPFAPAAGGIMVGVLALAAPGVLGVGYNLVSAAMNGQMALKMMLILLVLKILATTTCYGSGNAGGIFGPSLFIGAMLGGSLGQVVHSILPDYTGNAGAYALVGMGAAFAGIVRTPMTSVIMIFEVTRDYTIIVPLMIANLCSFLLAQRLQKLPIYEALSRQDGIAMPSAAHRLEPLLVSHAMRPVEGAAAEVENEVTVHPDDTLDSALQRLGETGLDKLSVISREGGGRIALLGTDDILEAYKSPRRREVTGPSKNWLPVVGFSTLAAVLIISGLVFWQRSRRSELANEAQQEARQLISQGRLDEAVISYRNALSSDPRNPKVRAALGLALVQAGDFKEASAYLSDVARTDPGNGAVRMGLARIAIAEGDKGKALVFLEQALAKEWPAEEEASRTEAQFEYAKLMAEAGRKNEAVSLLLTVIEHHGDDPAVAKRAADAVAAVGSAEQIEEAGLMLTNHFPADIGAWLRLAGARFAADKDRLALDAYRKALKVDPENVEAKRGVAQVEAVLALDPTLRGLSVRERARRWDEILQGVLTATAACGETPEMEAGRALLKKRQLNIETADRKMEAALGLWRGTDSTCKTDAALSHIMAKLKE